MKKNIFKTVWDNLEEIFLIPSFVFSVILIFVQVIARYMFNNSISWSEELARFLYVWQIWLGISICAKRGAHLRITLIFNVLKGKGEFALNLFANAVTFVFAVLMCKYGAQISAQIAGFNQKSAALKINMGIVYAGVAVGALLMAIRVVEDTFRQIKAHRASKEAQEGGIEIE